MQHNTDFWAKYQEKAWTTCLPSSQNMEYLSNAFIAEAGEVAGVAAKKIRGDYNDDPEKHKQLLMGEVGDCLWFLFSIRTFLKKQPVLDIWTVSVSWYANIEIYLMSDAVQYLMCTDDDTEFDNLFCDILDKLNAIAEHQGFTLEEAAEYNLEKLAKRYANNLIMGSGDFR